jgi:2-methylcitrate dehydratase
VIAGEKTAADAHPNGARPWRWDDYVVKFEGLTQHLLPEDKRGAFVAAAKRVRHLAPKDLFALIPAMAAGRVHPDRPTGEGIFDAAVSAPQAGSVP